MKKKNYKLSASLICGFSTYLGEDIRALEKGGIDALHFDVMDGRFVPRLGLYPELLQTIRKATRLPIDVHLMVEHPERFVETFVRAGADITVVHAESTPHLDRSIRMIRALGGRAGVALNPATPLSVLDYVLRDIDLVMLMAINPGIVGHKLIPSTIQKISDLRTKLFKYPNIIIEVDGGVSPESAAAMIDVGATMLVCGTSSIFKKGRNLTKTVRAFRDHIDKKLKKNP